MRSDEYHRLHAVCLDMAKQSTLPDVQARWQAIADEWLKLATEQRRSGRSAQNTSTASLAITGGVSRIPTCGVTTRQPASTHQVGEGKGRLAVSGRP
jgi:hypothetical protein